MLMVDVISEKVNKNVVSVTSAKGRVKLSAKGNAITAAVC
jgi:tRNA threonylcarbamoyladenosine modification (KEOPS) complex  Pcc1 subunit